MIVTSDMVKDLQKRVDVTYEEAERVLLKTGGNIDRAEHLLNRRRQSKTTRFREETGRIYREVITYYFKISRKEAILLNVPLLVVVGFFLVLTMDSKIWVGVIGIGLILISESEVSIYRVEAEDERIVRNEAKAERQSKEAAKETPRPKPEGREKEVDNTPIVDEINKKDDDDDYYEITIEK